MSWGQSNYQLLQQIVSRLSSVPGWNINAIREDEDRIVRWLQVEPASVVEDLVIREADLTEQVQTVAAQIQHWGRLVALCRRVMAATERKYRVWKNQQLLAQLQPPAGEDEAKGWKKPTQAVIEATYRTSREYAVWQQRRERLEEALNATEMVLEGWRAKKDLLRMAVIRRAEDSAPRLSV